MGDIIALISALAWPGAMLAISLLFRREVQGVLTRLGEFKYAGVEMTFRDDLRDAESLAGVVARAADRAEPTAPARVQLEVGPSESAELVGTLVGQEPATTTTTTTILVATPTRPAPRPTRSVESFVSLCGQSPRDGLLEAWGDLRAALIQAATTLGDRRAPAPVRVEGALRFLVDRGWLNALEGQLVERLRGLAGQVDCRDQAVAMDEARRFIDLAVPLIARVVALASPG